MQKSNGTKVQRNQFLFKKYIFLTYKMCMVNSKFSSENVKIGVYEQNQRIFNIWLQIWNQHKK